MKMETKDTPQTHPAGTGTYPHGAPAAPVPSRAAAVAGDGTKRFRFFQFQHLAIRADRFASMEGIVEEVPAEEGSTASLLTVIRADLPLFVDGEEVPQGHCRYLPHGAFVTLGDVARIWDSRVFRLVEWW